MKIERLSKIFACLLLFAGLLPAQADEAAEIRLNVAVTTKKGEWVTGLEAQNFKIYDEKKLRPVTYFSAADAPASVGILVDVSESADVDPPQIVEQALMNFINKSHPGNEYFLMAFDEERNFLLGTMSDGKTVLPSLKKLAEAKFDKNTAFYDALAAGLEKISKGSHAKKVLLVISDGQDNSSKNDFEDIRKLLKRSDVLVYNIGIIPAEAANNITSMQGQSFSEEITGLTGGKSMFPESREELLKNMLYVAEELRSQYVVGFKPDKSAEKDKKWRDVEIKIELPPNARNVVKSYARTRRGFYIN